MNSKGIDRTFIFLVNEERGEFDRYSLAGADICAGSLENVKYKLSINSDKRYAVWVVAAEEMKHNIGRNILEAPFFSTPDKRIVFLENRARSDGAILEPSVRGVISSVNDFLKNGLEGVINEVKKTEEVKADLLGELLKGEVTLFVHWGGGDIPSIQSLEQKLSNYFSSTIQLEKWVAHSLSSLRKTIFDVTVAKIEVPDLNGLIKLKIRLSMSAQLGDLLTKLQETCGLLGDGYDVNDNGVAIQANDQMDLLKLIDEINDDWMQGDVKERVKEDIKDYPFQGDDSGRRKIRADRLGLVLSKIAKEFT